MQAGRRPPSVSKLFHISPISLDTFGKSTGRPLMLNKWVSLALNGCGDADEYETRPWTFQAVLFVFVADVRSIAMLLRPSRNLVPRIDAVRVSSVGVLLESLVASLTVSDLSFDLEELTSMS